MRTSSRHPRRWGSRNTLHQGHLRPHLRFFSGRWCRRDPDWTRESLQVARFPSLLVRSSPRCLWMRPGDGYMIKSMKPMDSEFDGPEAKVEVNDGLRLESLIFSARTPVAGDSQTECRACCRRLAGGGCDFSERRGASSVHLRPADHCGAG
ncbi:hypothetical protein BD779DRAFT_328769 [Infundibulicybe gibba]|nr:hypothetical protein BD779DRAFT_328769 [Infundibulicybe gibba]